MQIVVSTFNNIEFVTIKEIKELLNLKAKKLIPARVTFSTNNYNNILKLRSIDICYNLLTKFKFKNKQDILKKVNQLDYSFIKKDFVIRCSRLGNHDFSSKDLEKEIGGIVFSKHYKVNLESSTIIFIDIINNNCLIGVLIAKNLSKRPYRIRLNSRSINAALAFSLLKVINIKKNETILDPFCNDATILIEAALSNFKNLIGLDSANNIKNSITNSKFAKANIKFYSYDISWLDTKFKKSSIDKIITILPYHTKHKNDSDLINLYKEFFHQSYYVVKDYIILLAYRPELVKKYATKFKLKKEIKTNINQANYSILLFTKVI